MRKLLGIALVVAVLIMPAVAKADITKFDDFSSTSINTGVWMSSPFVSGGGSFYQNGGPSGVLNFMANGTGFAEGNYKSNFSFDLNYDFYTKAQFNYGPALKQGGIGLGFYSLDQVNGNSKYIGSIDAVYDSDSTYIPPITLGKYFVGGAEQWTLGTPDKYIVIPASEHIVTRTIDSGWLGMRYDSALDKLDLAAFDTEPMPKQPATPIGGAGTTISGLRSLLTDKRVGFSLSGYTGLQSVTLAAGEATFDNFTAISTVPEPVSTILFITGGAVLAVRRLRRK